MAVRLRDWGDALSSRRVTASRTGIQDITITFATRVAIVLSGVAMQSLLAHTLLPAGRGAFAVCALFGSLLGVLFAPGSDAGAQHFVMAKRMSVSQGVSGSVMICLVGSMLAFSAALPMIASDLPFFQKSSAASFHVALLLVPLNTVAAAVQSQLAGLRRYGRLALFSLVRVGGNGVFVVLLVIVLDLGVVGAVAASCVSSLVMIVVCVRDLRRHEGLRWEVPARSSVRKILRYGFAYYLARVGWGVDVRIGVLFLGMLADAPEVGIFAVASGLMMQFRVISSAVSVPLLPRVTSSEGGRPDLVTLCARCTTWVTCVAVVVFLVVSVPMVTILLTAEFLSVVPLAIVIAPGIVVFAGANVLTAYFRSVHRPDVCSWAAGLGLAVNALSVPLLYGVLGVQAAAWGMTLGLICRSLVLAGKFHRMTKASASSCWFPQRGDYHRIEELMRSALRGFRRRSSTGP